MPNNIDWYQVLWISTLVFFNLFSLTGLILTLYGFFILASLYKKIHQTLASFNEKMNVLEESFTDWSWIAAPAASVISGLFYNRGEKKGVIKKILSILK
jgi:hypothetical protein